MQEFVWMGVGEGVGGREKRRAGGDRSRGWGG